MGDGEVINLERRGMHLPNRVFTVECYIKVPIGPHFDAIGPGARVYREDVSRRGVESGYGSRVLRCEIEVAIGVEHTGVRIGQTGLVFPDLAGQRIELAHSAV